MFAFATVATATSIHSVFGFYEKSGEINRGEKKVFENIREVFYLSMGRELVSMQAGKRANVSSRSEINDKIFQTLVCVN